MDLCAVHYLQKCIVLGYPVGLPNGCLDLAFAAYSAHGLASQTNQGSDPGKSQASFCEKIYQMTQEQNIHSKEDGLWIVVQ